MQTDIVIANSRAPARIAHWSLVGAKLAAAVQLGRPKFLAGGFASYALGTVIAHETSGVFDLRRCLVGQAVVSSLQLMTHYSNDYFDYEADVANRTPTSWSGGSRILANAVLPRRFALYAALFWALCAMGGMVWVRLLMTTSVVWWLMVAILLLAWSYSAPPLQLHSRGVGEITASVIVAALVPCLACVIQTGSIAPVVVMAALPLILLQFVMLLVLSVPDRSGDLAVGKKTLSVRLGINCAGFLHQVALFTAFASVPVLWLWGLPASIALAVLLPAPLALIQVFAVARGALHHSDAWPRLAFGSVALVFLTTIAEVLGALFLRRGGPG
ncbi:MAG TPA: prenyltransferase [Polyangiaceae bacterium]